MVTALTTPNLAFREEGIFSMWSMNRNDLTVPGLC
jgi:hypothetical protein